MNTLEAYNLMAQQLTTSQGAGWLTLNQEREQGELVHSSASSCYWKYF